MKIDSKLLALAAGLFSLTAIQAADNAEQQLDQLRKELKDAFAQTYDKVEKHLSKKTHTDFVLNNWEELWKKIDAKISAYVKANAKDNSAASLGLITAQGSNYFLRHFITMYNLAGESLKQTAKEQVERFLKDQSEMKQKLEADIQRIKASKFASKKQRFAAILALVYIEKIEEVFKKLSQELNK